MSDELELVPVEVTVIDETPFQSPGQAQDAMTEALVLLRDGEETKIRAHQLLDLARERGAAQILGFSSWDACLQAGLEDVFGVKIEHRARIRIAAGLRLEGRSTTEIAEMTFVDAATTSRDLKAAREMRMLDEEPEQVRAKDGKTYPSRRPLPPQPREDPDDRDERGQPGEPVAAVEATPAVKKPRRADFKKSWDRQIYDLIRVCNSLKSMREEDEKGEEKGKRYREHMEHLAHRCTGDIQRAHAILTDILEDFSLFQDSATIERSPREQ